MNEEHRLKYFIDHWEGKYVSYLFPSNVTKQYRVGEIKAGVCLLCRETPLAEGVMRPPGIDPNPFCVDCYNRLADTDGLTECVISGDRLVESKVIAQNKGPFDFANCIADGFAHDYYTLISNIVFGNVKIIPKGNDDGLIQVARDIPKPPAAGILDDFLGEKDDQEKIDDLTLIRRQIDRLENNPSPKEKYRTEDMYFHNRNPGESYPKWRERRYNEVMEAMNKVADEIDASVKKLPDEELDRISHPPRVVKLNPDAINTDPVEVQFFDLRLKKKGW